MSASQINLCRKFKALSVHPDGWTGQELREAGQGLPGMATEFSRTERG